MTKEDNTSSGFELVLVLRDEILPQSVRQRIYLLKVAECTVIIQRNVLVPTGI